ncbi:MAG: hypothetical protein DMG71_08940 [Acidobacteria bacterium]|nr:MAG: hypothetical protein DMG71_08940 [Acidobacteriota bacterium]
MGRWLTWVSDQHLQGWACSQCEWNFPIPSLLTDPEAKSAYDRLAAGKFQGHDCAQHPARTRTKSGTELFAERARKLVMRGYKPKDAVDLVLQEIMLEHRSEPKVVEQARADAEDFLRRIRQGLI